MSATSLQNRNAFKSFKRFSKRLIKGKTFRKSEFGTGIFDKTIRGALTRRKNRPEGHRAAPARLVIAPQAEEASSAQCEQEGDFFRSRSRPGPAKGTKCYANH